MNSLKSNVCDKEHKLYADDILVISKDTIHSVSVLLEVVETFQSYPVTKSSGINQKTYQYLQLAVLFKRIIQKNEPTVQSDVF